MGSMTSQMHRKSTSDDEVTHARVSGPQEKLAMIVLRYFA